MYPISVKRNNYFENRKNNNIQTPLGLSYFLYDILKDKIKKLGYIIDPACGSGNLLFPFYSNFPLIGIDITVPDFAIELDFFIQQNFLNLEKEDIENYTFKGIIKDTSLIIVNPPFNNRERGRKLLPELFLRKIFEIWGDNVPVVLFTPMGFRLNQRIKSKRWRYFRDKCKAKITSIISLPLDIFEKVEFHSEILAWNIYGIESHYWIPEKYINFEEGNNNG